jgi:hypothetical protein
MQHYRACKIASNGQNGGKTSKITVFGHFAGSNLQNCFSQTMTWVIYIVPKKITDQVAKNGFFAVQTQLMAYQINIMRSNSKDICEDS